MRATAANLLLLRWPRAGRRGGPTGATHHDGDLARRDEADPAVLRHAHLDELQVRLRSDGVRSASGAPPRPQLETAAVVPRVLWHGAAARPDQNPLASVPRLAVQRALLTPQVHQ